MKNHYSVKQIADLAGISRRTIHYYHEYGVLEPDHIDQRGYRYYSKESLFKLQQILIFREMEMDLTMIKEIMNQKNFDIKKALKKQRAILESRINRLHTLVNTIDKTMQNITGGLAMSDNEIFRGFDKTTEEAYAKKAEERWGEYAVESQKKWQSYSKDLQKHILEEAGAIYNEIAAHMDKAPDNSHIQDLISQWHNNLKYFYEPSREIMTGLAETYVEDSRFKKNFDKIDPDLAEYLRKAILIYTEKL